MFVFEGIDRSGKTTLIQKVKERLEKTGHEVVVFKFPNRTTEIGKLLDRFLRGELNFQPEVAHLLFSANRWEAESQIRTALKTKKVLIDRYSHSGIAYSMLNLEWCINTELGLPQPSKVFYLDISVETAMARSGFGEEKFEEKKYLERVQERYNKFDRKSWIVLDENLQANCDKVVEVIMTL